MKIIQKRVKKKKHLTISIAISPTCSITSIITAFCDSFGRCLLGFHSRPFLFVSLFMKYIYARGDPHPTVAFGCCDLTYQL